MVCNDVMTPIINNFESGFNFANGVSLFDIYQGFSYIIDKFYIAIYNRFFVSNFI